MLFRLVLDRVGHGFCQRPVRTVETKWEAEGDMSIQGGSRRGSSNLGGAFGYLTMREPILMVLILKVRTRRERKQQLRRLRQRRRWVT